MGATRRPQASQAPRAVRKRANRYHHGDLRRSLIQQAIATIAAEGVAGLTLRGAGTALGVSRSALYRHFADKSALLAAVATEGFRQLRVDLLAAWEGRQDLAAAFDDMGVAYVHFAVTNPSHYRVMFGGFVEWDTADSDLVQESAAAFAVLVDALVTQQRQGIVAAGDPLQLARYILAIVHGVAMLGIDQQLQRQHVDPEQLFRQATPWIRQGIAAIRTEN